MLIRYYLKKIIYILGLFMIIIPTSDLRKTYNSYLVYLGIVCLVLMALITGYKKYNFKISRIELCISVIWIVLLLSLLPAYVSGNITLNIIFEKGLIFLFYFILLAKSNITLQELFFSSICVNLYLAYRCFFELGVTVAYYQGTMLNPNQMALVLIGGGIGSLYFITTYKNKIIKLLGIVAFGITAILLFYTSSRTIMLVLIFACCIYMLYYIKEVNGVNIFLKTTISKKIFIFLCVLISVLSFLIIYFRSDITQFLFEKWGNNISRLLSGRTDIWNVIFKNMTIIGNYQSDINANNDFLDWLLKYGLISFVIYILLILINGVINIRKYLLNKTNDNLWILIIIFCYIIICMFENVHAIFGKSINIMFWTVMGFAMRNK